MEYHPSAFQIIAAGRGAELERRATQDRRAAKLIRNRIRSTPIWAPVAWRTGGWLIALGTRLRVIHQQTLCSTPHGDIELCSPS